MNKLSLLKQWKRQIMLDYIVCQSTSQFLTEDTYSTILPWQKVSQTSRKLQWNGFCHLSVQPLTAEYWLVWRETVEMIHRHLSVMEVMDCEVINSFAIHLFPNMSNCLKADLDMLFQWKCHIFLLQFISNFTVFCCWKQVLMISSYTKQYFVRIKANFMLQHQS